MQEILNELTGPNLKAKREQSLLTQSELAKEIGVIELTISNWENGKVTPSKKHLRALRKFFQSQK